MLAARAVLDSVRKSNGKPVWNNGTLSLGGQGKFSGPRSLIQRVRWFNHPLSPLDVAAEHADARPIVEGDAPMPSDLCPNVAARAHVAAAVAALSNQPAETVSSLRLSTLQTSEANAKEAADRFDLGQKLLEPVPEQKLLEPVPEQDSTQQDSRQLPAARDDKLPPPLGPQPREALAQFELAAAAGHQQAGLAAAKLYIAGDRKDGLPPNLSKAARLLESVIAGGWPAVAQLDERTKTTEAVSEAARLLGVLTAAGFAGEESIGGTWDPLAGRAVALYRLAAAGGDTVAQLSLGYRHRTAAGGDDGNCLAAAYYYRWVAQQSYKAVHTDKKSFYIEKKLLSEDWIRPTANLDQGQRGESDEHIQYRMMQAQQGDTAALSNIGDLYFFGARGMPRDLQTSFEHYSRAAAGGDAAAMAKIGSMAMKGEGTAENLTQAALHFNESANAGDPKGHNGLAYMYYYGRGLPQNYTEALASFSAAADADNPDGMYNAGMMHKEGRGIPEPNVTTAVRFFQRAAQHGHFDAIFMLGQIHLLGQLPDGRVSCGQALHYNRMAAEYGEWGQTLRAGFDAYLSGDSTTAVWQYETAAQMGFQVAMHNAVFLYDHDVAAFGGDRSDESIGDEPGWRLSSLQRHAKARRLLLMAHAEGSSSAALRLGDYEFFGYGKENVGGGGGGGDKGVDLTSEQGDVTPAGAAPQPDADYDAAMAYYRLAAATGSAQAEYSIGTLYEHGHGGSANGLPQRRLHSAP
eukprot:SAG22_NODE_1061_length_5763_cov_3.607345_3_plen_745_part_00